MTNGEALVLSEQLLELANRIKTRSEGPGVEEEFDMLYGRLRGVVHNLIPTQAVHVRAHGTNVTTHDNLIEAGYLSGSGEYEYQGRKQILMLVGMLRERAAKEPTAPADDSVIAIDAGETAMVDGTRLDELRRLPSSKFDFSRLVRLCEELNEAFRSANYHAVVFLFRGILDHVPPVFGVKTFPEVASNYGGGRSFKDAMEYLQNSARKIADGHLHNPIRSSEVLPNATQVNFGPSFDVLLGEIVRISRS